MTAAILASLGIIVCIFIYMVKKGVIKAGENRKEKEKQDKKDRKEDRREEREENSP